MMAPNTGRVSKSSLTLSRKLYQLFLIHGYSVIALTKIQEYFTIILKQVFEFKTKGFRIIN
jgi:hypothetical protein